VFVQAGIGVALSAFSGNLAECTRICRKEIHFLAHAQAARPRRFLAGVPSLEKSSGIVSIPTGPVRRRSDGPGSPKPGANSGVVPAIHRDIP